MTTALKTTWRARIWRPMVRCLLRLLLALLLALALAGAPVASQAAMPCHGMCDAPIAQHDGAPGFPAPCKGLVPACMSTLTCLSINALPAPQFSAGPHLTERPVAYLTANMSVHGRTVEPGLDPPITS
jgi:hypothetical protein